MGKSHLNISSVSTMIRHRALLVTTCFHAISPSYCPFLWFSVIVLNPSALALLCPCLLPHKQPSLLLLSHYCWSQFCYICIQIWYFYHNQGNHSLINYCQYSYIRTAGLASSAHSRACNTPLITVKFGCLSDDALPSLMALSVCIFLLCCLLYPAVSHVISDSSCVQIAEPLAWALSSACTP